LILVAAGRIEVLGGSDVNVVVGGTSVGGIGVEVSTVIVGLGSGVSVCIVVGTICSTPFSGWVGSFDMPQARVMLARVSRMMIRPAFLWMIRDIHMISP
jgi:hypothetical protein